jgi:hypothetical protein
LAASVLLSPAAGFFPERTLAAQSAIAAGGVVESKSGGFKFPDGSVQTAAATPLGQCPTLDPTDEMIWVGGVCVDKYESSIWDAPVGGNQITGPVPCASNGQDCDNIWARSVLGVVPRANITWFQAQAALANSGKRLPKNAEWQMAARGTPDHPGDCNTDSSGPQPAGNELFCVSDFSVFDMVGNLWEWVADWVPFSTGCPGWGTASDDYMCLSGASTMFESPGALLRGGNWFDEGSAGPLAVLGNFSPIGSSSDIGFRGAR